MLSEGSIFMHRRSAAKSTHILMKIALEEVERLVINHPELKIENPELLVSAFLQSATQIYIHETPGNEDQQK